MTRGGCVRAARGRRAAAALLAAVGLAALACPTLTQPAAAEDLYAKLGLEPTADARAVKKAYRTLSLEWHPDKAVACRRGGHVDGT